MKRITQWLNNLKLESKLFIVVAAACLLLLCTLITLLRPICNSYNMAVYGTTAKLMTTYSKQIDEKLGELETVTLSIIGDEVVQDSLYELNDIGKNTLYSSGLIEGIKARILNHYSGTREMRNVCVYLPDDEKALLTVGGVMNSEGLDIAEMIQAAKEKQGNLGIVVQNQRVFWVRQIRQKEALSLNCLGFLIGEINVRALLKTDIRSISLSDPELGFSVFINGETIYADNELFQPKGSDGWTINQKCLVSQHSSRSGWTYLFYTPYTSIVHSVRIVIISVVVSSCVIMFVVLLGSRKVLKRILQEFELLVGRFDAYAKGILPTEIEMAPYDIREDEIGYLNRQFKQMVYAHKRLEDENYQRMLLHQEAQYKQLQHQIRPHFIFNTLSMISWSAYQKEDSETAKLINALAELLRAGMSNNDITVKLSREKKLVESYIHILSMRYKNRIDFQLSIPSELDEVLIPCMTLQPIIENAVNYGLEEGLEHSVIRVCAWEEQNNVILTVEDNGPGVEPDILEKLDVGEKKPNGNGVGLMNVQKRIQLAFSEEYGLSFHRINEFTQVRITIPKRIE